MATISKSCALVIQTLHAIFVGVGGANKIDQLEKYV